MTRSAFRKSIRRAYFFLKECGLLRSCTGFEPRVASDEFWRLACDRATPYRELFLCGLKNGDYAFLLVDYSYFQFSHARDECYRFAYYPTPFGGVSGASLRSLEGDVEGGRLAFEEYAAIVSEQPLESTIPLIRFELDCAAYVPLKHPAAHFHIGTHGANRWPAARCVSPRAFVLLIAKLYYGTEWEEMGRLTRSVDPFSNRFDRMYCEEKSECALLRGELFGDQEKGQFYVG